MSEKVHPPTPRRRQKAKEQGRAPRSGDVVSSGLLLATTGLLAWQGPKISQYLMGSLRDQLSQPMTLSTDRWQACQTIVKSVAAVGYMVLPMLIGMMMCGVVLNLIQTGWSITPSKLAPSLQRISPADRLKSILSARSFGRFGIVVLKLAAVIAVSISLARNSLPQLVHITLMPLPTIATTIFEMLIRACVWVGTTLLAFACVDYCLAWWQHERDLMMTEQELREEMRDAEGAKQPVKTARTQPVQGVA